jgi:hypothetical protein
VPLLISTPREHEQCFHLESKTSKSPLLMKKCFYEAFPSGSLSHNPYAPVFKGIRKHNG